MTSTSETNHKSHSSEQRQNQAKLDLDRISRKLRENSSGSTTAELVKYSKELSNIRETLKKEDSSVKIILNKVQESLAKNYEDSFMNRDKKTQISDEEKREVYKKNFDELVEIITRGGGIVEGELDFVSSDNRRIIATKDIKINEIVTSIPEKFLFFAGTPSLKRFLSNKNKENNTQLELNKKDINTNLLQYFIAYTAEKFPQFLDYTPNPDKKQTSSRKNHGADWETIFPHYLRLLPKDLSNFPAFYPDSLTKLFKNTGTTLELKIKEKEERMERMIKLVRKNFPSVKSSDSFLKALYIFYTSRDFSSRWKSKGGYFPSSFCFIVPIVDMYNYDQKNCNTRWSFESKSRSFVLRASKKIQKGEEIIDHYGDKGNQVMINTYGYTFPKNRSNYFEYYLDDDTSQIIINDGRISNSGYKSLIEAIGKRSSKDDDSEDTRNKSNGLVTKITNLLATKSHFSKLEKRLSRTTRNLCKLESLVKNKKKSQQLSQKIYSEIDVKRVLKYDLSYVKNINTKLTGYVCMVKYSILSALGGEDSEETKALVPSEEVRELIEKDYKLKGVEELCMEDLNNLLEKVNKFGNISSCAEIFTKKKYMKLKSSTDINNVFD